MIDDMDRILLKKVRKKKKSFHSAINCRNLSTDEMDDLFLS